MLRPHKLLALVLAFIIFALPASSFAAVWVNGYYRSDGTYVRGHYRSEPNGLKYDNYSWSSGDSLYNDSYYSSDRSRSWYTPSYTWDSDYLNGYNYNTSQGSRYNNNYVNGYYGSSVYDSLYNSYDYSWSY